MPEGGPFDPKAYWEERGESYAVSAANVAEELNHLAAWLREEKPRNVLDVGSGWGRIFVALRAKGMADGRAWRMVDFAESMRRGCERRTGVLPDSWDGRTLPYGDGSFELVFAWDVLLHIPPVNVGRVFSEMARCSSRWLYATAPGIVWRELAEHCFWHDYLALADRERLYVARASIFRRGLRMHWLFEKPGKRGRR